MLLDNGAEWYPTGIFVWVDLVVRCPSRTLVQKWKRLHAVPEQICWVVVPTVPIEDLDKKKGS